MKNFYFLLLFILFYVFVLSSCGKEEFAENDETDNTIFMSIRPDGVIDGGTLPEVTVTGNYINPSDGGWWYPPFPNEPPGPPSPPPLPTIVGGGGGGTSPGKPLPTVKLAKDLVTLFPGGTTLSKADLEKLNWEFKRMMVHCEYEALNNLLKSKNFDGGKIVMLPEDVIGLLAVNWPSGDLNIIGSDAIDATNLAHEWIHLAQGALNPGKCRFETAKYEGMMEFELLVFQDVMHYAKHGTTKHLQPETDFPTNQQWIANLTLDDSEKDKYYYLYDTWIKTTFMAEGNSVSITPDKIAGTVALYNYFMYQFFIYSRNYGQRDFKIENDYGFTVLSALINSVRNHCYQ